jgi:hypothetical protein
VYNFWQFLHVTFAIAWVGGSILMIFLAMRFSKFGDNPVAGPATGLVAATSVPLFMVASLGTLATGLVLAFGWIGFQPLWIKLGLGGIAISLVMGFGYHKPHGAKLEQAVKERGPQDPGVQAMMRQSTMVGIVETLILIGVVWAMVAKPL